MTCWALKNRPGSYISGLKHYMQNHLNQLQNFFSIAVQKAIVSDPTKPFWQNMLQNEPEKVFAFGHTVAGFAAAAFNVFKGDASVLVGDDIFFTDDAPVQVPRQIFQSAQPPSGVGAVGHPFPRH